MGFVWFFFWLAHIALAFSAIVTILRRRGEPTSMLAWIFAILLLPVLGSCLYMLFGFGRVRRKARRRRRRVGQLLRSLGQHAAANAGVESQVVPSDLAPIERVARRVADMPAVGGNLVEAFDDSAAIYGALEASIRAARRHVHLLYYIWQSDETGRHFRDLLVEKARQGVTCRVLLDSVGCLTLGRRFTQPWIDAGVRVAFFLPLYPLPKRLSLHLRNHRKIAVIDGHTALIGSQNIGDEYRGRLARLSPWYDSHLRIRGPAALFLQQVFAEDWLFATREHLSGDEHFAAPEAAGDSVVQVVPSGPDGDVSALSQLLFAAISSARSSVRIATPYFVPDEGLRLALLHAAIRGVRVQLVLPSRSDNALVLWAGRSFYAELLEAGVEIYEFDAGMLHSKVVVVDERWCLLGSANMDIRSFRFNFEASVLVYDAPVSAALARQVQSHVARSSRVTLPDAMRRPLHVQLAEGAARLFAPML